MPGCPPPGEAQQCSGLEKSTACWVSCTYSALLFLAGLGGSWGYPSHTLVSLSVVTQGIVAMLVHAIALVPIYTAVCSSVYLFAVHRVSRRLSSRKKGTSWVA